MLSGADEGLWFATALVLAAVGQISRSKLAVAIADWPLLVLMSTLQALQVIRPRETKHGRGSGSEVEHVAFHGDALKPLPRACLLPPRSSPQCGSAITPQRARLDEACSRVIA